MEWNRYQRKIVKAPEAIDEETLDGRQVRAQDIGAKTEGLKG